MSLSIETYALCKKYCDSHASHLTTDQAIQAVSNYFDENPNSIVTNSELESILENYLTEHQDISAYRTSEDQDIIDATKANVGDSYTKSESDEKYLTSHQDISGKQDILIAGDNITIAEDGKTISAIVEEVDLSEYAKTTEVNTAVNTAVADLIDGAPEALDTLKELADKFEGVATQIWVEEKNYLTAHQDISNKLNVLPVVDDQNDPGYGYPYWIPYNFEFTPQSDKVELTLHALTLDNNFSKMDFNKDIPIATTSSAGFMSSADKTKLDGLSQYTVTIDI